LVPISTPRPSHFFHSLNHSLTHKHEDFQNPHQELKNTCAWTLNQVNLYSKTCSILNKNVKHGEKKVKRQAKAKGNSEAEEGLERTIENLEKNTFI